MKAINNKPFILSSLMDSIDKENIYYVKVIYGNDYSFNCELQVNIYDKNYNLILEDANNKHIYLKKGFYYIKINSSKSTDFKLDVEGLNKPYAPFPIKRSNNKTNTFKVSKRKGYTYIYNNVPENMTPNVLNTIIMENKDLEGECFLTFENQNNTTKDIYMGYRIMNPNDHPIYVTVSNVGYQYDGSWLGEKSWMDYYGVKYEIDISSFKNKIVNVDGKEMSASKWFNDYLHFDLDYIPHPITPTTYMLMPHSHIYVIGGTTIDAFKNINVNDTANHLVGRGCFNGNVRFSITNGKAIGHLCVYNDVNVINSKDVEINNLKKYSEHDDLGGRIGIEKNSGVIDLSATFEIDDNKDGLLEVNYSNKYGDSIESITPNKKISNIKTYNHTSTMWYTHLSSQLHHEYLGYDMVEHKTYYKGKKITLSTFRGNPVGKIWDYGNWMIEYQENFTFINKGNKNRTLAFHKLNNGSIFYIIKDSKGNILKQGTTLILGTGNIPIYELNLKANEKKKLIIHYVLPANNNGSIKHYINVK